MKRRGAVAIIVALLALPLLLMAGLGVDGARLWLLRTRLQASVDAAALLAANEINKPARDADAKGLFWINFSQAGAGQPGFLGATSTGATVTQVDLTHVQVAAQATLPLTLMMLGGSRNAVVSAASIVQKGGGLELALVLDNTGSMAGGSMTSLISASQQLLDILYGSADTQPNLYVSVVPFAATVNIGNTHTNWLVGGAINQTPFAPSRWMGCVMARTSATGAQDGDDFNDNAPSASPFSPFLYQSTWHAYPRSGPIVYTTGSGAQRVSHNYWYPGDNDWTISPNNIQEPDASNNSVGPNLGCPSLAIMPETASKATVLAEVNNMVAVYRGGTIISLGLQAGWLTLSPNWRGLWGTAALPLDYNTPNVKKAIILMTDGNNEWYDWPDGVPGQTPPTAPPSGVPRWFADGNADFTAYGRLLTNTRGVAPADITATLNTWMSQMCTTIKQNGIIIYTVLFNNNSATTQALFRSCASSPGNYFLSPTQADLQAAFQAIGQQLATLRLTQ